MKIDFAEHLPESERVRLGSYYTPERLVRIIYEFIKPYLLTRANNAIILDTAAGCGAFLSNAKELHVDYRAADCDAQACEFLKKLIDEEKVINTNSLANVNRSKFTVPLSAFLIIIGNPPYNDITSEVRKGRKGENICDKDLFDRDLGISFLKSYDKLNADVVSVLHPLSYLIKKANFERLKGFKNNYRLIKGLIFPSSLFTETSKKSAFPVLASLYEKNANGMSFAYIENFEFDVLNSKFKFAISNYTTTDGYINKYPPRKSEPQESPIGLYYHTFRDFNSLMRNASFTKDKSSTGVVVTVENLYKYAYLYALKRLFRPRDVWLYGNMSPLVNIDDLETNKDIYILYALKTNKVLRELEDSFRASILRYYRINPMLLRKTNLEELETKIVSRLNRLTSTHNRRTVT